MTRREVRRVLLVDDSAAELEVCARTLAELPHVEVRDVGHSDEAARLLASEPFDLLLTDLLMPRMDGLDLLRVAHAHDPELPVVVLTGYPSVDTAVEALRAGATDYLVKPAHPDEMRSLVERLLEGRRLLGEKRLLERHAGRTHAFGDLVGAGPGMLAVFDTLRRLEASDVDVLVVGETGTGKELVARHLHAGSPDHGRFVAVDCGAIPEALAERELFGHERGAFTGADGRALGLLEFADGGTLFLDELQALAPSIQSKLLRALQERAVRRVGGVREVPAAFRVVAAFNESPEDLVRSGRLREDLYYRLNVGRIEIPPLRERSEDVPLLVDHFLARYGNRGTRPVRALAADALAALHGYPWPGNVRELENLVRRAVAMTDREVLTREDLPEQILAGAGDAPRPDAPFFELRDREMDAFEVRYLTRLLRECRGVVSEAARRADLPRGTLYRLLKKHGLRPVAFRPD